MVTCKAPPRFCSICRIGDGPLVPAAYVVRAPDGCEWFECVECVKLDRESGQETTVTVVGLYEWFRARGLPYPTTC
jgi:hypothetical protein